MESDRDELRRLVEQMPDDEVPAALADLRRHLYPVRDRRWPPAFFGAGRSSRPDVGVRTDELLEEGFGRAG